MGLFLSLMNNGIFVKTIELITQVPTVGSLISGYGGLYSDYFIPKDLINDYNGTSVVRNVDELGITEHGDDILSNYRIKNFENTVEAEAETSVIDHIGDNIEEDKQEEEIEEEEARLKREMDEEEAKLKKEMEEEEAELDKEAKKAEADLDKEAEKAEDELEKEAVEAEKQNQEQLALPEPEQQLALPPGEDCGMSM